MNEKLQKLLDNALNASGLALNSLSEARHHAGLAVYAATTDRARDRAHRAQARMYRAICAIVAARKDLAAVDNRNKA